MEQLQFDPERLSGIQISHCLKHIFPRLAGQSQDHMYHGGNFQHAQLYQGVFKTGQFVAPADETGGSFVYGL